MVENPKEFIRIIQDELNYNPVNVINNFDELMALQDIIYSEEKISNLKIDTSIYPRVFNISLDTSEDAKGLKEKIDSHIEVSKFNRRYLISTSQLNNMVMIQLKDKA